ncbi:MAG: hypothetical protein KGN76_04455, partial [Acidobacteriota bacterium]|nr:hypothetical protein [Acidobacteriota bacterium]
MDEGLSRRDLLKTAAATVSYLAVDGLPPAEAQAPAPVGTAGATPAANGTILALDSTSGVFIPPRGDAFQKFSYGFPEPSVAFDGLSIGFRIHTFENTYGLDRERMKVTPDDDGLLVECAGFVWAGGQQKVDGTLRAHIRRADAFTEWDAQVEMDQPVKSVVSIARGVPRGRLAGGTEDFFNPNDDEILFGYPWGASRQRDARGINTPLAMVEAGKNDYFFLSCLMDQVRVARLYFQPGADGYRVELVYEQAGWNKSNRLEGARWRAGRTKTADAAFQPHVQHVEQAYRLPAWEHRTDVPAWFNDVQLVLSIHGMHWSGYVFNDFAKALRILEWTSTQIDPKKVMVFLPAWDGRYYWEYPVYKVDDRMGGEAGFRRLLGEGHRMGFRFVPMFGLNSANTKLPDYAQLAGASTREIDGNTFTLAWVDWDNDRHD